MERPEFKVLGGFRLLHNVEHDDTSVSRSLKLRATATGNKKIAIFAITRQFYTNSPYAAIICVGKAKQDSYAINGSTIVENSGIVISFSGVDSFNLDVTISKGSGNAMGQIKIIELYNDGILTTASWA